MQLTIISPTWEIIGTRSIDLSGASAKAHEFAYAESGSEYKIHGKSGLPGNPGGPAGTFLAIGNHFINDNELSVYMTGGAGSNGQHGGDGLNTFILNILIISIMLIFTQKNITPIMNYFL